MTACPAAISGAAAAALGRAMAWPRWSRWKTAVVGNSFSWSDFYRKQLASMRHAQGYFDRHDLNPGGGNSQWESATQSPAEQRPSGHT